MGQSDSREPKVQPEGQTGQREFTPQEAKDYCEKIKAEVNKDMYYIQ